VVHVDKSDTPISASSPHPVAESLLKHWFLSKDNYIYIIVNEKFLVIYLYPKRLNKEPYYPYFLPLISPVYSTFCLNIPILTYFLSLISLF